MEYHCGITQDDTIYIFSEERIQDTQIMKMHNDIGRQILLSSQTG